MSDLTLHQSPPPVPAAYVVLSLLQRRFQLAAARAFEAEAAAGRGLDLLEALRAFLDGKAPAPSAFRAALEHGGRT